MKPAILIKNLTVAYEQTYAFEQLSCIIPVGTLVAIVGPNGAGKSTLLQAIMQLIPTQSGQISIFDQSHTQKNNRIAYIAQRSCVDWTFPASVFDVVMMGRYGHLKFGKRPTACDTNIVMQALEKVCLLDLLDRPIGQLSGGQQQRVFLARALAQQADLYIMDEPFAGVDAVTEKIMLNLFTDLKHENKTVVVVHHDLITVKKYFDTVFFMNKKTIAYGPIATTFTTENIARTFDNTTPIHDDTFL